MTNLPLQTKTHALSIAHIPLSAPLFLAPMAGQTNYAFRQLCREVGGVGLTCTELLSSQSCPQCHRSSHLSAGSDRCYGLGRWVAAVSTNTFR